MEANVWGMCILILVLVEKNRMTLMGGGGSESLESWILKL